MSQTGIQPASLNKDKHKCVKIMDKQGHIDNDPVTIKWKEGEQVLWSTSLQEGFTIKFDGPGGSPFAHGPTFQVPVGGSISSGIATKGGRYKYTVHGPDGSHDPDVILDPPQ